jgi:hypothetical protein
VRINYNSTRRPPSPAIPISALRISRPYPSFRRSASSLQNLIANLELEFRVSPIRINELKFSNRKFSAILTKVRGFIPSVNAFKVMSVPLALSHPRKPLLPRSADREPQATVILIANRRLKSELSGKDSSRLQISNRERMAIFHRAFLAFSSFEPPAPPEALAAVACSSWRAANRYTGIRNRNNAYRFSRFQFHNRYKTCLLRPGSFSGMRALHPPWRYSIFQLNSERPTKSQLRSESSEWYHPSPPWSILEATHREIRISSLVQEGALTWGT